MDKYELKYWVEGLIRKEFAEFGHEDITDAFRHAALLESLVVGHADTPEVIEKIVQDYTVAFMKAYRTGTPYGLSGAVAVERLMEITDG